MFDIYYSNCFIMLQLIFYIYCCFYLCIYPKEELLGIGIVNLSRCYQIVFPVVYNKLHSHEQYVLFFPASSPNLVVITFKIFVHVMKNGMSLLIFFLMSEIEQFYSDILISIYISSQMTLLSHILCLFYCGFKNLFTWDLKCLLCVLCYIFTFLSFHFT